MLTHSTKVKYKKLYYQPVGSQHRSCSCKCSSPQKAPYHGVSLHRFSVCNKPHTTSLALGVTQVVRMAWAVPCLGAASMLAEVVGYGLCCQGYGYGDADSR